MGKPLLGGGGNIILLHSINYSYIWWYRVQGVKVKRKIAKICVKWTTYNCKERVINIDKKIRMRKDEVVEVECKMKKRWKVEE